MIHARKCFGLAYFSSNLYGRLCRRTLSESAVCKLLGIETSCDDTGCAIVDNTGKILGEALHSQNLVHLRNGGINPMVAQELHRDNIDIVVNKTFTDQVTIKDVDAVAVTVKPGLLVSLQIGVKYANYLARKFNKPLIDIHHMEAHALVARMYYKIPYPFLVLLISGGHSILAIVQDVDEFLLLGNTLDDAPGEAFDKVARRMKLRNIPEYATLPGGQAVEMAASKSTNPQLFQFPLPLIKKRDCSFSFSGLKDSLNRSLLIKEAEHNIMGSDIIPEINDLCAGFQIAVTEHLVNKTERAMEFCTLKNFIPAECRNLVVSGGVACNNFIYKALDELGRVNNFKVFRPPPNVCTDNGVMIAWNGIEKLRKGYKFKTRIDMSDIEPKAPLGTSMVEEVLKANIPLRITRLKKLCSQYCIVFI